MKLSWCGNQTTVRLLSIFHPAVLPLAVTCCNCSACKCFLVYHLHLHSCRVDTLAVTFHIGYVFFSASSALLLCCLCAAIHFGRAQSICDGNLDEEKLLMYSAVEQLIVRGAQCGSWSPLPSAASVHTTSIRQCSDDKLRTFSPSQVLRVLETNTRFECVTRLLI